jgi:uncharacterized coiled-coil DUF342 family protein
MEQIMLEQILQAAEAEIDRLTAQLQDVTQMALEAVDQRDDAVNRLAAYKRCLACAN